MDLFLKYFVGAGIIIALLFFALAWLLKWDLTLFILK